jgi:putative transposase
VTGPRPALAAHARVGNLRRDALHKLTTGLATTYATIVVEDLNVAGMPHNRRLAPHIADAGFADLRRQLDYKTRWRAGTLAVADRWFPSSKTCSACQTVTLPDVPLASFAEAKLSLATRTVTCHACGVVIDRDLNAAINLQHHVALSGRETRNGRGADRKIKPGSAGGHEASTPHRETGQDGDRRPVTAGCNVDTH